ncbi:hypothetical protein ACFY3N_17565 [Streptomyces sp. NPDC000348]|uniref:hypothetical protein n=1 Tax=Streptomyces sp. NPDC000348 TaxID=3364538 RepID=UPI003688FE75
MHLLDDGDTLFTPTTGTHPLGTANPLALDNVLTAGRGRGDPRDRTRRGHRRVGRARIDGAETTKVLNAAQAANVVATHITVISRLEGLPGKADNEDLFSTKDYLWLHTRAASPSTRQT